LRGNLAFWIVRVPFLPGLECRGGLHPKSPYAASIDRTSMEDGMHKSIFAMLLALAMFVPEGMSHEF
jgi:hypothetical protein